MTTKDFTLTEEMKNIEHAIMAGSNVMVTGGAGVGKSTFIKYLKGLGHNFVFLAPTGMVAMGGAVRGTTIHSFFKIPFGGALRNDYVTNINQEFTLPIIKHASMIIIDEISMVRSDVFQTIDNTLRAFMKNDSPFGGKQIILVGDVYQLPPIVSNQSDKRLLMDEYGSKYFFGTDAFRNGKFSVFELTKIFRQKDEVFINILNSIKYGTADNQCLNILNTNVPIKTDKSVIITTKNNSVDAYNQQELDLLVETEETFVADIVGIINTKNVRSPEILKLKKGCKIMTLVNNGTLYNNGTIGTYVGYNDSEKTLKMELPDGKIVNISKYEFKNVEFKYNKEKRSVDEDIRGTMSQYPVTLAYSISVHKCIEENQLVNTGRQFTKIKDLCVGDTVLTHTGECSKVSNVIYTGIKNCAKIKMLSGIELIATYDHPLFDGKNWVKISDLNVGDKLVNVHSERIVDTQTNFCNISYLLGYLVGDGSYSGYSKKDKYKIEIIFNKYETSNIEKIVNILNEENIKHTLEPLIGRNVKRIRIHNKDFRIKLFELGLDYCKRENKTIPKSILFSNDTNKIKCFIGGLWDSDGSCGLNMVRVNGISDIFIQLQQLLSLIGIGSTVRPQKFTKNTKKQSYVLYVVKDDLKKFKQNIPIFCVHKIINLDVLCKKCGNNNRSNYWIKYVDGELMNMATNNKQKRKFVSKKIANRYMLKYINEKSKNVDIERYVNNIWRDDVIESIIDVGDKKTYDIEVEYNQSFVSQGFACHNSQGMTFDNVIFDIGGGAFDSGQTYVALSRCTSLNGLKITGKITPDDMWVDREVNEFTNKYVKKQHV
jgi:energy-coupling factor transporter ATP-binding protein EcfA2